MKALLLAILSVSLVLSLDRDLDRYLTKQAVAWKKTPIKAQWIEERFGKYYQPAGVWNIHLKEGVDADEFARSLDMEVVQHLESLGNIYVLRPIRNESNLHLKREEVSRAVHARLEARSEQHHWVEEDFIRTYDKYQTDPRFGNQWHLENRQTPGADANVKAAWKLGVTGASVQIAIVDDSFQTTHPDLAPGYNAADSFNFNNNNNNPNPVATEDNHGTSCAGVAGARDDGVSCGVGAAYRAKLAGIRTIGGPISDAGIASSLTYKNQNSAIYSCSWGIPDCNVQGNTALCQIVPISRVKLQALERGTTEGRGGKGSIFLFAAGNYRLYGSNTNNQDFCTQRQVIAVAASTNRGGVSYYSTAGAGLLVAAPSSGDGRVGELGITTSDRIGTNLGYDPASDCTNGFGGTSSATPLVAGIVALMLDKNPALTWRDVQDILVHTASKINPDDPGWQTNGAGLHVSHDFGFGNVDAEAAVIAADERTIHLTCDKSATSQTTTANLQIPDNSATGVESSTTVSGVTEIVSLESMRVTVNIQHTARGDLQIILVSPSGTESILAEPRNDPAPNYVNWNFKTNFNWDESPNGKWTLKVIDRAAADAGTLNNWSMTFYGKCPGEEQPKKLSSKAVAGVVIGVIVGAVVVVGIIIFVVVRKKQGKSVLPFKG